MTTVLAIDLGGTKTSTALVREDSTVIERAKRRSERTLEGTVAQIRAAYDHADIADGIGIVVPGIYNPHTGMAWAPNLWGWDHVPLRDALARAFDVPLIISSDRTGGVLGEAWVGSAAGLNDVVFVAVAPCCMYAITGWPSVRMRTRMSRSGFCRAVA